MARLFDAGVSMAETSETQLGRRTPLVTLLVSAPEDCELHLVIRAAGDLVRTGKRVQIVVAEDEERPKARDFDALIRAACRVQSGSVPANDLQLVQSTFTGARQGEAAAKVCGSILLCFSRLEDKRMRREAPCEPDVLFLHDFDELARFRGFVHAGTRIRLLDSNRKSPPAFLNSLPNGDFSPKHARAAPTLARTVRDVLIVGAGMAGAFAAHALCRRGFRLSVVDAGCVPASGASALYAGLAHPHWEAKETYGYRLTRAGTECLAELLEAYPNCVHKCGVLDLAVDPAEEERFRRTCQALQQECKIPVARFLSAEAARSCCGMPVRFGGLWYESGRLVNAGGLVRALFDATKAPVLTNAEIRLRQENGLWLAVNSAGVVLAKASAVVAASGLQSPQLFGDSPEEYGVSPLYGRISLLRDTDCMGLAVPVTGRGYAARTQDGYVGVGATYERGDEPVLSAQEAHAENAAILRRLLLDAGRVFPCGFYEGIRAVAKDRMPIMGAMADIRAIVGLDPMRIEAKDVPLLEKAWGIFALGSRGLSWGLILAEALAAQMAGEFSPLTRSLLDAVSPAGHALRVLRERKRQAQERA